MSNQFLEHLNGENRGAFRRWLDGLSGEPRIAWYPSSGGDFRDLLYLHGNYAKLSPPSEIEPPPPDLYLHTDYSPGFSGFSGGQKLHEDTRTTIKVREVEELPRLSLPQDRGIVYAPLFPAFLEGSTSWFLRCSLIRSAGTACPSYTPS